MVALSLLLFSCGEEEKQPDYVWPEDQFIEVLTEFQLAEAVIRLGYHRGEDSIYHNDSVFNAMFRKFEVSAEEFDSNYSYYLNDPESFTKIYEQVITNLSLRAAELEKETEKPKAQKTSTKAPEGKSSKNRSRPKKGKKKGKSQKKTGKKSSKKN